MSDYENSDSGGLFELLVDLGIIAGTLWLGGKALGAVLGAMKRAGLRNLINNLSDDQYDELVETIEDLISSGDMTTEEEEIVSILAPILDIDLENLGEDEDDVDESDDEEEDSAPEEDEKVICPNCQREVSSDDLRTCERDGTEFCTYCGESGFCSYDCYKRDKKCPTCGKWVEKLFICDWCGEKICENCRYDGGIYGFFCNYNHFNDRWHYDNDDDDD